jgi:hypothetical protein
VFKNFWLKLIFMPEEERWKLFEKKKKSIVENCYYEIEKYNRVKGMKKGGAGEDSDGEDSILAMID